jgi:hypothetical protein
MRLRKTRMNAEKEATRRFWARQSKYVPFSVRAANPDSNQKTHPHIIYDDRVDLEAPRVYNRPINAEGIDRQLKRSHIELTLDEKLQFRTHPKNAIPTDLATLLGHTGRDAERIRGLHPRVYSTAHHGLSLIHI